MQQITLGGGCFWCLDAAYRDIGGVEEVVSGYAGGDVEAPTYEQVCSGRTGHAEVVQVSFDEDTLPLDDVLRIFFTIHDPTTKDRQGADVGTQYRSIILTGDAEQEAAARRAVQEAQQHWDDPIVTQVVALERFWPAEAYHQDYYNQNSSAGYCQAVISPKLSKLRRTWAHRLKA